MDGKDTFHNRLAGKTMMKGAHLLVSAVLVSGISLSFGADSSAWLPDFKKADLNDSGGLSRVELDKSGSQHLQPLKDHFDTIDTDRDGHVTIQEYEHFLRGSDDRLTAKFRQADLNDSGGLSRKELEKIADRDFDVIRRNFDVIDADRDGHVTWAEYQNYLKTGASGVESSRYSQDQCQGECGYVIDIHHQKVEGEGSALGAIAGGLAGGLLGRQVGKGTGKTVATIGGAAGGAYAGHLIEKNMKTKTVAVVRVKFDNGTQRDFDFDAETSPFQRGARVQLRNGQLTHFIGQ